MTTPSPPRRYDWRHILTAVLAALAAGAGITAAVTDDGHGGRTVTVHVGSSSSSAAAAARATPDVVAVDNADANAKPDNPVVLSPAAKTVAAGFAVTPRDLTSDKAGLPPLEGTGDQGPIAKALPPFASDSVPGCRTRFLPTNWSYRSAGAKPSLFWLHYSGGPDKPGTRAEVDGLTAFGSSSSSAVSWHFNMDRDGNCDYNVPLRYKAWTEAGANSTGISIEVAGTGGAPYLRPAGYRELARIYLELRRRYGIPLRLGAVSNCSPTRSGIVTHWMGGPCSGGHTDVRPLAVTAIISELRKYVGQASSSSTRRAELVKTIRAKHQRTHRLIVKAKCAHGAPGGKPITYGYCKTLRARNVEVHRRAKAAKIGLGGTYR